MREIELKAKLLGFLLGDGWISESYTNETKYYQIGFSGDAKSLGNAKRDLIFLLGDIGKAEITTKHTFSPKYGIEGITSKFAGNQKTAHYFIGAGAPIGKRVEQNWFIPRWVLNGSDKIKSLFISGFYAAEGYTPSFQKNNKTPRVLGFNFHKREFLQDNCLVMQFSHILFQLGVKHTVKETRVKTSEWNRRIEFSIDNSHDNIKKFLSILDLSYSEEKERLRKDVLSYLKSKDLVLDNLNNALLESRDLSIKAKVIAEKYSIDHNLVHRWRSRKTEEAKLPNTFPTFSEYMALSPSSAMVIE